MHACTLECDGKLLSLNCLVVPPTAQQQITTVMCRLQNGPRGVYGISLTHPSLKRASSVRRKHGSSIGSTDKSRGNVTFMMCIPGNWRKPQLFLLRMAKASAYLQMVMSFIEEFSSAFTSFKITTYGVDINTPCHLKSMRIRLNGLKLKKGAPALCVNKCLQLMKILDWFCSPSPLPRWYGSIMNHAFHHCHIRAICLG